MIIYPNCRMMIEILSLMIVSFQSLGKMTMPIQLIKVPCKVLLNKIKRPIVNRSEITKVISCYFAKLKISQNRAKIFFLKITKKLCLV